MGVEYLQFRAVQLLSRALPRRVAYALSDLVSDVFFAFDKYSRPAIRSNLRRIHTFKGETLSDAALDRLARRTFQGSSRNFVDFFHFGRLSRSDLARLFRIEGDHYIREGLARGKGVIAFTAHFGCYDMGAPVLAALGHPTRIVVLPWKDPKAEALFERQRKLRGVKGIAVGRAARGCIETLLRGEVLAFAGDFDYSLHDERIHFLGAPMRMPFGHARLALRTGATLVPCFVTRRPSGRYLARCLEPIIPRTGETILELQARIVRVLERVVLEHPHDWYVFSDMWDAEWSLEIARAGSPRELAAAAKRAHRGNARSTAAGLHPRGVPLPQNGSPSTP